MSDFFGGGGSWKSSVDNYYTFTQTSGGGSSGGGSSGGSKGCGTSIVIIIIILVAAAKSVAAALIVLGCLGLVACIAYLIVRKISNKPSPTAKMDNRKPDSIKPGEKHTKENLEWEGGRFIGFINIAGTSFIKDKKEADDSTFVGDKLTLSREPDNPHDPKAIIISNKSGLKLGYVPRNHNTYPAEIMDSGKELFGRLYSKSFTDKVLILTAELFLRDEQAPT